MPRLGKRKLREKYTMVNERGFLKVSPVVDLLPRQQRDRVNRAIRHRRSTRIAKSH